LFQYRDVDRSTPLPVPRHPRRRHSPGALAAVPGRSQRRGIGTPRCRIDQEDPRIKQQTLPGARPMETGGGPSVSQPRVERDSMGELEVPAAAYFGAQARRAALNFAISPLRLPRSMIRALGLIKKAAAHVNLDLGLLDRERAEPIIEAANAVAEGRH